MKLTQSNIKTLYSEYDNRVIEYLENVLCDIKDSKGVINNYTKCIFDLLATQLQIYYASVDQLMKLSDLTSEDSYRRVSKSPVVSILNKSHSNILDVLNKLSLSPFESAKLKKLNKDDDTDENLLDKLIND